jgi:glycosyltransferase involved in cell wall biosynthesis
VPLWPPREGYALRVAALLPELARDWAITLLAPTSDDLAGPARARLAEFVPVAIPGRWALMPSQYDTRPLRLAATEAIRRTAPRAALLWTGAEFLGFESGAPPAVADRIDCMALISWRHRSEGTLRERVRTIRAAAEYGRYERRIVRALRTTVVVGEDDARALRRLAGRGSVEVIPNGVTLGTPPALDDEGPRPTVIFSGVMGYAPNVGAVEFFATEVWPAVRETLPAARFVIAGRNPTPAVTTLAVRPGIELRSDVPDMSRTLREAWVAVAPMRSGAGIKNKVLEAWAVGKPVVMTSLAGNGLRLDPEARSLVADEPAALAALVVRLLGDGEERRRLGAAGYALAGREHGWAAAGRRLSRLLAAAGGLP